ncbi:MAG: response regulator transcription factor [Chloroflexi bacterium]|jgi:DNA-binding response OmpR family regulator|nr:response regulator transcription factor [Chloroflexota bacterium]MBT4072836.1 response regulator transcription factor [Chloroflexota bacterium]MBT4515589.1 response regulator transcription factor [Chloroflexota bacterium]MBT5318802.1 response regulator transcription factor [Chloroflexota bacterium]MBT6681608.1 response regulator transcription factor [Chloroflexota bacterium]
MNSNTSVLVVEDEPEILELISTLLRLENLDVMTASSGEEGLRAFFQRRPDLAILDIGLPGMSGIDLCGRIREVSEMPVIFLSAFGDEADRVKGLRMGADDYMVKPFGADELKARVAAVLRRAAMPAVGEDRSDFTDGEVLIDHGAHTVVVRGEPVSLTPLEYRMLSVLSGHRGQVLSQDRLLDLVWGADAMEAAPESVRLCVSHLRSKIEANPRRPKLVETVRGFGYRYAAAA